MERIACLIGVFFVVILFLTPPFAFSQDLEVNNFTLISKQRVSRVEYNYTYKAHINNNGLGANNVSATVTSNSPNTVIVDGEINFGDVAAGGTATSSDTFTIRQNRRYAFSWSDLVWEIQHEQPQLTGEVELPSNIDSQQVEVKAPGGIYSIGEGGAFTIPNPPENPFFVAATVNGDTVALSFFDPNKTGNKISCLETGVSLVMLHSMLFAVPRELLPEMLDRVKNVSEVQALAATVCSELSNASNALVNPDEDFKNAVQNASVAAQQAVQNQLAPQL